MVVPGIWVVEMPTGHHLRQGYSYIIRRRGFMDIASVRLLSPVIDDATRAELDDLMHALDLDDSDL